MRREVLAEFGDPIAYLTVGTGCFVAYIVLCVRKDYVAAVVCWCATMVLFNLVPRAVRRIRRRGLE